MTTEEALIEISQIRSRQKKEQVGATRFELMQWTGRTLRDTLADIREMTDAGVITAHPTINGVFYKFTNKAYYEAKN